MPSQYLKLLWLSLTNTETSRLVYCEFDQILLWDWMFWSMEACMAFLPLHICIGVFCPKTFSINFNCVVCLIVFLFVCWVSCMHRMGCSELHWSCCCDLKQRCPCGVGWVKQYPHKCVLTVSPFWAIWREKTSLPTAHPSDMVESVGYGNIFLNSSSFVRGTWTNLHPKSP